MNGKSFSTQKTGNESHCPNKHYVWHPARVSTAVYQPWRERLYSPSPVYLACSEPGWLATRLRARDRLDPVGVAVRESTGDHATHHQLDLVIND